MRIDSYEFGKINIDGKKYISDVLILLDQVEDWWRSEGHEVSPGDLETAVNLAPELIIIGTGASSIMKVPEETELFLKDKRIELIIASTPDAVQLYNELSVKKKVIAGLHLTC